MPRSTPSEQLHREVGHLGLVVDAGVQHLDDVLALDGRRHRGLALEPFAEARLVEQVREHHLERAAPQVAPIDDLVDGAHPAGRHRTHDLVPRGEEAADGQGDGVRFDDHRAKVET